MNDVVTGMTKQQADMGSRFMIMNTPITTAMFLFRLPFEQTLVTILIMEIDLLLRKYFCLSSMRSENKGYASTSLAMRECLLKITAKTGSNWDETVNKE